MFNVCPACGYAHPFLRLPLFIISGASGTGKTALALAMAGKDNLCVHLESDILWRGEKELIGRHWPVSQEVVPHG